MNHWECSGEESCSDHHYITFAIVYSTAHKAAFNFHSTKCIAKEDKCEEFSNVLTTELSKWILMTPNFKNILSHEDLDGELCKKISAGTDTEKLVRDYSGIINTVCRKCFKTSKPSRRSIQRKTVPWWTDTFTILHKRTDTLRGLYQKTRND